MKQAERAPGEGWTAKGLDDSALTPSGHRVVLDKGMRWRCLLCLSSAESLKEIRRWQCVKTAGQTNSTHRLQQAGEFVFCVSCGYYSNQRCRSLAFACTPPGPKDFSRKRRLELLIAGRHPTKRFHIGKVVAFDARAEWQLLRACAGVSRATLEDASGALSEEFALADIDQDMLDTLVDEEVSLL